MNRSKLGLILIILLFSACSSMDQQDEDDWQLGPFNKYQGNPVLSAQGSTWENKVVFNPGAWTDGETIYLLYRAEASDKPSRIGLALSTDGYHFEREPEPVFEPKGEWELPRGVEDPRLVKIDDTFYMTYIAFDGKTARNALATSKDLRNWERIGTDGLTFPEVGWSKAGAIVPQKINGRYWMYFGDTDMWVAWSEDLINWNVIDEPVMRRRDGMFDSRVVEPGPPPIITDEGILLIYNAANEDLVYRPGQALFDINDPTKLLKRSENYFMKPETRLELRGQTPNQPKSGKFSDRTVVFAEGLVKLDDTWFLYFGMGDTAIGVAVYEE